MIRQTLDPERGRNSEQLTSPQNSAFSSNDYRQKLVASLGAGVEALKAPEIEAKVIAYYAAHPNDSRNATHVAAIACRFKKEQVLERFAVHHAKTCFPFAKSRLC